MTARWLHPHARAEGWGHPELKSNEADQTESRARQVGGTRSGITYCQVSTGVVPARDDERGGEAVPIKSCRGRGDFASGGPFSRPPPFHGDKARDSFCAGQISRTVARGQQATGLFPGTTPTGGTFQQAGAGATGSPPGGRDTEGRQEVRWQIDAVWQLLGPGKAAPPASPAARRIFFGSFTPVRLWLPHTHRRGGRRKGAPLLGTAKNA